MNLIVLKYKLITDNQEHMMNNLSRMLQSLMINKEKNKKKKKTFLLLIQIIDNNHLQIKILLIYKIKIMSK